MEPELTIRGAQERLTPEQAAEADRIAAQCIAYYRSTEPCDERAAEELLWRAYEAVGLTPPRHIHWLDGPLELVAVLAQGCKWMDGITDSISITDSITERVPHCVWDDCARASEEIAHLHEARAQTADFRVRSVQQGVEERLRATFGLPWGIGVMGGVSHRIRWDIREQIGQNIGGFLWRSLGSEVGYPVSQRPIDRDGSRESAALWQSMCAFDDADRLACLQFFGAYYKHNEAHALAHLNRMVCGYWLSDGVALLVRRPTTLMLDDEGRLHNETGMCIAFADGWGCYGWHGAEVSEQVILAPETLTRTDYLYARDRTTRRIIQERMGAQRFVWEMQARFIDGGSRGILYEVDLPGDPERIARYVQVQDASTGQEYFVRVPPDIQTAAEAVAWSFDLPTEEYHPAQEA